jgi:hypothetical protein
MTARMVGEAGLKVSIAVTSTADRSNLPLVMAPEQYQVKLSG